MSSGSSSAATPLPRGLAAAARTPFDGSLQGVMVHALRVTSGPAASPSVCLCGRLS
jgi:hypothetical protein